MASFIGSVNHFNRFLSFANRILTQFSAASPGKGARVILLVSIPLSEGSFVKIEFEHR